MELTSKLVRVALYIRVSTDEQAQEGYSIAAQREKLTQFAQFNDWVIADYYIDEGRSAKNTLRPELTRLLDDVSACLIDIVLVYRLDRLTRSVKDLYFLLDHFDKNNTGFRSATEVYDTTSAMGRLFITIVAALAQWERENLGERVQFGLEQMAREGKFHGGFVPFGYIRKGNGVFVIDNEKKPVVRAMFDMALLGWGYIRIAKAINNSYPYSKDGKGWNDYTIRYILKNPVYYGARSWHDPKDDDYFEVEEAAPAIVTKEEFDRVQKILESRSTMHPRQAHGDYIFSGRIFCSRCGSAIIGTSTTTSGIRYKDYRCRNAKVGHCDLPSISELKLQKKFLQHLAFIREELNSSAYEVAVTSDDISDVDVEAEIQRIEKELQKIKDRRKKWQLLFADDLLTIEELRERTEEDGQREKELVHEMAELRKQEQPQEMSSEQLATALVEMNEMWETLDDFAKKNAVYMLVDKMVVDVESSGKYSRNKDVIINEVSFR